MHGQYCLTTLRRVMQLAKHLSAFCRQRFSQSVTRSLWSKQLSRAFIEQTLVSTNISLGGKLSRLLRFFSRPSFPFFLSQTINENCTCCCCVQSCFIDYRAYTRNWNTFLLYLKSFYYPDYHYTCTHQICLFLFLNFIAQFRQVYRENMLFDSSFFGKSSELGWFDEWERRLKELKKRCSRCIISLKLECGVERMEEENFGSFNCINFSFLLSRCSRYIIFIQQ